MRFARKEGAIAAGSQYTAQAGIEVFEKGGNAFDAAVACCFTSFFTEGTLASAAGGGFLLARSAIVGIYLVAPFSGQKWNLTPVQRVLSVTWVTD